MEGDLKLTHAEAREKYLAATIEVEDKIRKSRLKRRNDPFDSFEWFISVGIADTQKQVSSYRIYVGKGKFVLRNSSLFNSETHEIIPGNWSF